MMLVLQDANSGISFFTKRNITSALDRNKSNFSGAQAESYQSTLCSNQLAFLGPPSELQLDRLISCHRVRAVAQYFLEKSVNCSSVTGLSLKNVKVVPDVMLLLCSALQRAALQQLDLTNCGLSGPTAEALLPLVASSRLTHLLVGGNSWSSQQLSSILQIGVSVSKLGLAGLGESCFRPESSCVPLISSMTNLTELELDGFNDDAAELVLSQCCTGLTSLSLNGAAELKQLPASMRRLSRLTSLHIDGCAEVYSLPMWLKDLTCLTVLTRKGCDIQYPPKQCLDDMIKMRQFMNDAARDAKPWRRLKVVFLGNGRSGKTSLLRALARLQFDSEERSTRGVTVDSFADKLKPNLFDKLAGVDLDLSFWDFAGQLEYSASHDFFMSSKQAVYVIVFSAMDDGESQHQQLLYWLSAVARRSLQRLARIMIVCTKTDLLYDSCVKEVKSELASLVEVSDGAAAVAPGGIVAAAAPKFKQALTNMRLMVSKVLEEMNVSAEIAFGSRESVILENGFSPVTASKEVLFVTSNTRFCMQLAAADGSDAQTLDFENLRRALKVCLYSTCDHIFRSQDDSLNYPKRFRKMTKNVTELREALCSKDRVPFCCLTDELAVKSLGNGKKTYVLDSEIMDALRVLDNLGILVLYHVADAQCICAEPQYLSSVMSLLADPQSSITSVTTVELLEQELIKESGITRCKTKPSAQDLRELLVSVGLVVPSKDDPTRLNIPLALRGRPVRWQEVHQLQDALVIGRRLGSCISRVSASAFMHLMTYKCRAQGCMMGCAFVYAVDDGGLVFVRLLEDRSKVDVVVVSCDGDGARSEVRAFAAATAHTGV
jgi:GTPase SAR1 family protein